MAVTWRLVSPLGVRIDRSMESTYVRRGLSRQMGFLSNRKPNTGRAQRELGSRLTAQPFDLAVAFYEKASSAVGAGDGLLDAIALECAAVVNGTGD
jgi:hypothetical protein